MTARADIDAALQRATETGAVPGVVGLATAFSLFQAPRKDATAALGA